MRGFTGGKKAGCSTRIFLMRPLGMGVKSEERPQQKVYSRAGDKTRGLELEEKIWIFS